MTTTAVRGTQYSIREHDNGYYVGRVGRNGYFTIAGPYLTRYEAEVEARRRASARRSGHGVAA